MAKLIADNRILWSSTPQGRPRKKQFLSELSGEYTGYSSIVGEDFYTRNGTNEQLQIWGEVKFDFPKSVGLIQELLEQATDKDSIILDSFAGSGTTAHAVLNLNKKDGGNRKFILIEMMDYADTITAERVRRVISGYGEGKNAVEGTGGGFDFYEIGPVLMEKGLLNDSVPAEEIRRYVWYMETHDAHGYAGESDFLGVANDTAYYFHYLPGEATMLDEEYLATITERAESYVIYADICMLSEDFMERHHIVFKKIPRDIAVI